MVKRCNNCKKKLGLVGITCKCEKEFCGKCRYPEKHNCYYDYRSNFQERLKLENIKLVGKKVDLI